MTDDRITMDARAEAVEAMREAIRATDNGIDQTSYAELATVALDALLSPRVVPCSECGGTGKVTRPFNAFTRGEPGRCPTCNGSGQVSFPPLAVLMGSLEQIEGGRFTLHDIGMNNAITVKEIDGDGCFYPVYRLVRSREEEGT